MTTHKGLVALRATVAAAALLLTTNSVAQTDEDQSEPTIDPSSPSAFDASVRKMGSQLEQGDIREFSLALTALSMERTQELSRSMEDLMSEGASEKDIEAARDRLFYRAFKPLEGMNAATVVKEGKEVAQENDMTLKQLERMLDAPIIKK